MLPKQYGYLNMTPNKTSGYNANYILLAIFVYFGLVFLYLQNNPKMFTADISFGTQRQVFCHDCIISHYIDKFHINISRYVVTGMDMNCNQDPLYLETSPDQFEPPEFLEDKRYCSDTCKSNIQYYTSKQL